MKKPAPTSLPALRSARVPNVPAIDGHGRGTAGTPSFTPTRVIDLIESTDPATRDLALDAWCRDRSFAALLAATEALDVYRRGETNLYKRVRALFFIAAIHRYHLPARAEMPRLG